MMQEEELQTLREENFLLKALFDELLPLQALLCLRDALG